MVKDSQAMLSSLRLRNFKCFDEHEVSFEPLTIVVGANNAGKTTIAEALRIVSIVTSRYTALSYKDPPRWLNIPKRLVGCKPSLNEQQIRFDTLFHRYGDPPAHLTAKFGGVGTIDIYIGSTGNVHAVITDSHGRTIRSKAEALRLRLPRVSILPQVGPLARTERLLGPDYVRGSASSHLAPLHFRNQLWLAGKEMRNEFQRVVEETWPGVQVRGLEQVGSDEETELHLGIRERDFVAEVGAMGHGLQMWMQTMWFLTYSQEANTVILDEPDVYMHADLQRRLIRFLRDKYSQIIVTTHSTEIMSEVEPSAIVVVDRKRLKSQRVSSLPGVQKVIDRVGSVHNIHLTRLWTARRFLVIEGENLKLFKVFQDILFPKSTVPVDTIPHMRIPGWGAWNWAVGSSMFLKNAAEEAIKVICILDSDYHTPQQIAGRIEEAHTRGVQLHIWQEKEIENYLLQPEVITQLIIQNASKRTTTPSVSEITDRLKLSADKLKDQAFDGYAQEYLAEDRKGGLTPANKKARELLKKRESEGRGIVGLVSGKALLSLMSEWSQQEFGVGLSSIGLARAMREEEMPEELKQVMEYIEYAGEA